MPGPSVLFGQPLISIKNHTKQGLDVLKNMVHYGIK
jgi:hypothetical protein